MPYRVRESQLVRTVNYQMMLLTDNDVCQSVDLIRQNTVATRGNRAKKAKFTQSSYIGESSAVAHNKRVHR